MTPAELKDLARKFRAEAEGWQARTNEAGRGWKRSDPDAWPKKVHWWHLGDTTAALTQAARACEDAARFMEIVNRPKEETPA